MSDYIHRKDLKRAILDSTFLPDWVRVLINRVIDDQPTANVAPIINARWLYGNDGYGNEHYYCSHCLKDALNDNNGEYCLSHRCPHCGAHMHEEESNG